MLLVTVVCFSPARAEAAAYWAGLNSWMQLGSEIRGHLLEPLSG